MPHASLCTCGSLHPSGSSCPTARPRRGPKPSGRNGSTREWRRIRAFVLHRDERTCQGCGAAEADGAKLEVDHIDGDWRNNALENLRTVCFGCNPRGGRVGRGRGTVGA